MKLFCIFYALFPDILSNPEYQNWMDVITFQQVEVTSQEKENLKPVQSIPTAFKEETEEELQMQETKKKNNRKKTALLMGQLHDDMMFLDKIANHPALQKNILILKEEDGKAPQKDIDKVKHFPSKNQGLPYTIYNLQALREIRGAATDGLQFLEVRKNFWETSEPPIKEVKRKTLKRSRSEQNSRRKIVEDNNISMLVT